MSDTKKRKYQMEKTLQVQNVPWGFQDSLQLSQAGRKPKLNRTRKNALCFDFNNVFNNFCQKLEVGNRPAEFIPKIKA